MKKTPTDSNINPPFGWITDYITLSIVDRDPYPFELWDGTHRIYFSSFTISDAANFSKPFLLKAGNSEIMLTRIQMEIFFKEFMALCS